MTNAVRERFERFARQEAAGRSEIYADWAAGIAADPEAQRILARIPAQHRQPPLVFAVTRMLGAPVGAYQPWREFLLAHADNVVAECARRRVQTNEPLRAAALLPALSTIDGPIALLEIGASAGLCLYPDRYSYRLIDDEGSERAALDPRDGASEVLLRSTVRGELPTLRMPTIVWRAGIDLAPLDARSEKDRAWLRSLVWPGERGREQRITAALDVAAADPPLLIEGDAAEQLDSVASRAPSGATLVISTPGVLVYLPRAERQALIERIRALPARWLTIDQPGLHDWDGPPPEVPDGATVVALDGRMEAVADPLGRWWEWRERSAASIA